jgi:hypothetical protein
MNLNFKKIIRVLYFIWIISAIGFNVFGQPDSLKSISVVESYKLITANKIVHNLINQKYSDTTITNYIKFDESFTKRQDYYEYWIYQEQPRLQKIFPILILRINRFDKSIYVYDSIKDIVIPIDKWNKNNNR